MTVNRQYRKLNPSGSTPREISEVVNNLLDGKSNNTGTITLNTGGATTTTIYNERIGYDSVILLSAADYISSTTFYPYGAFQDSTDQTATANTATVIKFDTTDYALGTSLASGTKLTAGYSGLYNIQFSLQFNNSDSQLHTASVWFRKNGTDIANSNSDFDVTSSHGGVNGAVVAALNFFVALQKNDYIELVWSTSNTSVTIQYIPTRTTPTRPATPSAIATMQYLSANGYTSDLFTAPYISATTKGEATISHAANSVSGMVYKYLVVG
jgi:hypothetical protein